MEKGGWKHTELVEENFSLVLVGIAITQDNVNQTKKKPLAP